MLELRLMGKEEEIEQFLNEFIFPKTREKNENGEMKIAQNNGIYYENKRKDKCYKRRYIKLHYTNKADVSE